MSIYVGKILSAITAAVIQTRDISDKSAHDSSDTQLPLSFHKFIWLTLAKELPST